MECRGMETYSPGGVFLVVAIVLAPFLVDANPPQPMLPVGEVVMNTNRPFYCQGEPVAITATGWAGVPSVGDFPTTFWAVTNASVGTVFETANLLLVTGSFNGTLNGTWNQTYRFMHGQPPSGEQVPLGAYTIWFYEIPRPNETVPGWIPTEIVIVECGGGPVADAGQDQTVYVGDVVQFDGTGSHGPDGPWETEVVDTDRLVGRESSMALDNDDYPHISYFDEMNKDLKYAKWTESGWKLETVDSPGMVGWWISMDLDTNGYPHISYHDLTKHVLKYARWNGTEWNIETVDPTHSVGGYTSIALDSNDHPHISYSDLIKTNLKYARWNGTAWNTETVDALWGTGAYTSIALDTNDNPHISYWQYVNDTDTNLRYASWTGNIWNITTIDSAGVVGEYTSIALDTNDNPHMSYRDRTNRAVKYAKQIGDTWDVRTVDSEGDAGLCTSLALDSNDNPHMSYYDDTNMVLKYAKWTGSNWSIEKVELLEDVGVCTSMALDSNNTPHISYQELTDRTLKHAKKVDSIISYDWDFDDSSPHGSGARPTHIYNMPGIYNVSLRVTDAHGAKDSDNCMITVLPGNSPPIADANGPYYGYEGSPITLDASGSFDADGDSLEYRWDYENDNVYDTNWSADPKSSKTWHDDHSGYAKLQVRSPGGNEILNITGPPIATSAVGGGEERGQSFVSTTDAIMGVGLNVARNWGMPNDFLHVAIRSNLTGPDLVNGTIDPSTLPLRDPFWVELDLPDIPVVQGETYYIVLTSEPSNNSGVYHLWATWDNYTGGSAYARMAGSGWIESPLFDFLFAIHGEGFQYSSDTAEVSVSNVEPTIGVAGSYFGQENLPISLEGTITDPGSDDVMFTIDWGDGTSETRTYFNNGVGPDPPNSSSGIHPFMVRVNTTHTYGDDGIFLVIITARDDDQGLSGAQTTVVVGNVPPTVSVFSYSLNVSFSFRMAGEKWHNVEIHLYEDTTEVGYGNITRYPGNPNEQMVALGEFSIDFSKTYSAIAYYTPEDDPINGQIWGATPAWVILEYEDGEERIHHTFNVRHEDTWTWEIDDFSPYFLGHNITFTATASDPGSDDLTFSWDWGDGTLTEHIYYNDGVSPDPYPSPDVNPISVEDTAAHSYASTGTYTITLTVLDDDGGSVGISLSLTI